MFHAIDETCMMLDVINQISEQNEAQQQGMKRIFGLEINELIMRQTKAKLAVFRSRS
jgi:hypothetical protein